MTRREQHAELIRRLLAGEDPAALPPADALVVEELTSALELVSLSAEPLDPSRDLRSAIVASAEAGPSLGGFARRTAEFFQIDESKAQALLASVVDVESEPWFSDAQPGVRIRLVEAGPSIAADAAACLLVHMQPGISYPTHRHLGDEWCLFLQGRGLEHDGREWNPGDLVVNPGGTEHVNLRSTDDGPCVFALVIHEGVEFPDRPS